MALRYEQEMSFNQKWFRDIQFQSIQGTIETFTKTDEREVSIVKPPRTGKSNVIRMIAVSMIDTGLSNCAVVVNPTVYLRSQMARKSEFDKLIRSAEIKNLKFTVQTAELPQWVKNPNVNGENFICVTIHALTSRRSLFLEWVATETKKGRPPVIFIDETHSYADGRTWGQIATEAHALGAYVVYLTGTPYRADGADMPGFLKEEVGSRNRMEWKEWGAVCSSNPEIDLTKPHERYCITNRGYRVPVRYKGVFHYGFEHCWVEQREGHAIVCKIDHIPVDIEVSSNNSQQELMRTWLSQLPRYKAKLAIGNLVRRSDIIRKHVDGFVRYLNQMKSNCPHLQGIIFTGNDRADDDENHHAKQVERIIKKADPKLRCLIATCSNEEKITNLITGFNKGPDDILIVKQGASVGIDAPRIKVGMDLSSVREYVPCIQRMFRIATPYEWFNPVTNRTEWIEHAYWITPMDPFWSEHYDTVVDRNGGKAIHRVIEQTQESIEIFEPKEGAEPTCFDYGNVVFLTSRDTDGRVLSDNDQALLDEIFKKKNWSSLSSRLTNAEVVALWREANPNWTPPETPNDVHQEDDEVPEVIDLGSKLEQYHTNLNGKASKIASAILREQGLDKSINKGYWNEQYRDTISRIWSRAKQIAGLSGSEKREIRNFSDLDRLSDALDIVRKESYIDLD